jgi:hypothetical protein
MKELEKELEIIKDLDYQFSEDNLAMVIDINDFPSKEIDKFQEVVGSLDIIEFIHRSSSNNEYHMVFNKEKMKLFLKKHRRNKRLEELCK